MNGDYMMSMKIGTGLADDGKRFVGVVMIDGVDTFWTTAEDYTTEAEALTAADELGELVMNSMNKAMRGMGYINTGMDSRDVQ